MINRERGFLLFIDIEKVFDKINRVLLKKN